MKTEGVAKERYPDGEQEDRFWKDLRIPLGLAAERA